MNIKYFLFINRNLYLVSDSQNMVKDVLILYQFCCSKGILFFTSFVAVKPYIQGPMMELYTSAQWTQEEQPTKYLLIQVIQSCT